MAEMIHSICVWCQTEFDQPPIALTIDLESCPNICSDCLINLLPQELVTPSERRAQMENWTERRQNERFPLLSQIYFTAEKQTSQVTQAIILDISSTGMKLQISHPIMVGEHVTMGFVGKEIIYKATGEIMHIKAVGSIKDLNFEVGIQISGIQQEILEN